MLSFIKYINYNKKLILISFVILGSLFVFFDNFSKISNKSIKDIFMKSNQEKNFQDIEKFKEGFLELLEKRNLIEAIEILDNYIEILNKDDATNAVEVFMHYSHYFNFYNNGFYNLIEKANKDRIKGDKIHKYFRNHSDNEIRNLYNEFLKSFYCFKIDKNEKYVNELGLSYTDINYDIILNKYGKYISDDLYNLIKLYKDEELLIFSSEKDILDLDKTLSNILNMESFVYSNSNSKYLEEVKNNLNFQYQAYFGYSEWTNLFDEDNLLKDEVKKHYINTSREHKKKLVGKKSRDFLKILEEENFHKTANVEVFLLDLTNVKYETVNG